jgi:hypothetical protein
MLLTVVFECYVVNIALGVANDGMAIGGWYVRCNGAAICQAHFLTRINVQEIALVDPTALVVVVGTQ